MSDDEFLELAASQAGVIGITAIFGAVFGFLLQLLVAYNFGAGQATDAFFMAQSTSEMLSKLLLGGSIAAVFLPMFVERLAHGKRDEAWQLALNLFHISGATLIFLLATIAIFSRPFVQFIAPGFDAETSSLTIRLLYVLLPSFLCLFLVDLATAMFHSLRRFALPASIRLIAPVISIISVGLLASSLGIYSLAIGTVAGSVIQFIILCFGLRHQGLRYQFIFAPRDPAIKKLFRLVYPFAFSVLAAQAAGIVYRVLVSHLSIGSLSSLKYAEKIFQLLTYVFIGSITTVLFPLLSEKAGRGDRIGMRETIASAVRLITFITLPMVIGITILHEPIIGFIYQRGSFTPEDTSMTAVALLFLGLGITVNGISSVLGHAVLALQKTRAAMIVTITSQGIAIILFALLAPPMAHAGLALASSLVPVVITLLYFIYLRNFIPELGTIFWHRTLVKIALCSSALMAVVLLIQTYTSEIFPFSRLFIPTVAGAAVYLFTAYLLKIPEMHQSLAMFQKKFSKVTSL